MRRTVVRLLDQGYYVLRVALVDPDGAEVGDAYLGAVDIGEWSDDRGWLGGYVGDLADEIRSQYVAGLARKVGTVPAILEGVAA